jgi:hypothetical protein
MATSVEMGDMVGEVDISRRGGDTPEIEDPS